MSNKPLVLFDMDGTLTPPRKKAEASIIESLSKLSEYCDIGILTGSDLEYVIQQMPQIPDLVSSMKSSLDILPCNGTKRYSYTSGVGYQHLSSTDMVRELGQELYQKIILSCISMQEEIIKSYSDLPFTGTFIQYRGSLLNWCPIGRDAKDAERSQWELRDHEQNIREKYQKRLSGLFSKWKCNVTVALGGSTSFDIYPSGWDKTYGLTHYSSKECYFVGDKCKPGGNDWHIYKKLSKLGTAYETTSPEHTEQIINQIISRVSKS